MEKYTYLQIALGIAAFSWIAVGLKWKIVEYITKPATMIALFAFIWFLRPGLVIHGSINWLLFAIAFSLLGDVFFMLPDEYYLPGLIAFSIAHIAYILSFGFTAPPFNLVSMLVVLMVGVTIFRVYNRLTAGLQASGDTKLKLLILMHLIIISIMVIFALMTLTIQGWENYRALLVSAGTLLLLISNIWMIWDCFGKEHGFRGVRVVITYNLGQCLLCLGFLITF